MTPTNPTATPNEGEDATRGKIWRTKIQASNLNPAINAPVSWEFSRQLRRQFIIRCCLLSSAIFAFQLDFYRHGLLLETTGAFSSTSLLTLALLIFLIRALVSAFRMIRYQFSRRLQKKHLLVLILLPAACIAPGILKIPGFTDGAAHTIRKLNISDQLVAAVADELAKPRDDHWRLEPDKEKEILTKDPFSRFGLKYAHLRFRESSLLFEFGSPIANRWGFSISGTKGVAPIVPAECSDLKSASKEIVVFWGPPD